MRHGVIVGQRKEGRGRYVIAIEAKKPLYRKLVINRRGPGRQRAHKSKQRHLVVWFISTAPGVAHELLVRGENEREGSVKPLLKAC